MINKNAKIIDVAVYMPEKVLTNYELSSLYPDWSANKIFEKTGILERRIADEKQTAGDMAFEAASSLFKQGLVTADDVDFVILCTQAPDYILPTTACILQSRLGIRKKSGAIDINLGCSGYVYGLSVAKGLIETGAAKCILLLTADTYSKYIHPMDKSVRTLFGDAATATAIIAEDEEAESIGPFVFGTDGNGADNLIVKAGMFRMPYSEDTAVDKVDNSGNVRSENNLYMNGAEVLAFSLKEVPKAADDLLLKAIKNKEDIDFFILHQANKFMLDALQKKMKIPTEKFPVIIKHCGNTVSSTIPVVLCQLKKDKRIGRGQKLMLIGFGVGYSWAACLLKF
jgi:3-oxoacyl-[acyl-carrier-protein] synthase-3